MNARLKDSEQLTGLREMVIRRLDMNFDLTDEMLLAVIDQVLMTWEEKRKLPLAEKLRYRKTLFDSFRRLDILSDAMEDPEITEIMVNGPGEIFVEKNGEITRYPAGFCSAQKLSDLVQSIVSKVNRRVNEASPLADARLEDGSRVNIVLPPVALNGPVVTIRRFKREPPDMEKLVAWGTLPAEAAAFLEQLVKARYNIFISGGTGSGKTTFLGALAGFIPENERVITIEDSAELRLLQVKNLVRLEARAANEEGQYAVTIRDLIRNSLRMRPDRIIVGEIRSGEALDMLQAMNSGHDGSLSTGHGNSAPDMISRIETMVFMSGAELPLAAVRGQIASAIDVFVHLGRLRDGSRKVLAIEEMAGIDESGRVRLKPIYRFTETGESEGRIVGRLEKTGELASRGKLRAAGIVPAAAETDGD